MDKPYIIVDFPEEPGNSGIVHSSWLTGPNTCLWPDKNPEQSCIKVLRPSPSWRQVRISEISRKATWVDATSRLNRLLNGVSSESEPDGGKRKRFKSSRREDFVYDSDDGLLDVPPPPNTKPLRPVKATNALLGNQPAVYSQASHNPHQVRTPPEQMYSQQTSDHSDATYMYYPPTGQPNYATLQPFNYNESERVEKAIGNLWTAFEGRITSLETTIGEKLQSFGEKLKEITEQAFGERNKNTEGSSSQHNFKLPVADIETLQELEKRLADQGFRRWVLEHLRLQTSADLKKSVRSILGVLLTDDVLKEFSYLGKKKKKSFKGLEVDSLLKDAVRTHPKALKTPEDDIEKAAQVYLKHAPQRITRAKKTSDVADTSLSESEDEDGQSST